MLLEMQNKIKSYQKTKSRHITLKKISVTIHSAHIICREVSLDLNGRLRTTPYVDAYWYYGKPRQWIIYNLMKSSRTKFKYALRKCKNNEKTILADKLVTQLNNKSDKEFWKEIKTKTNSRVKLPNKINNASGDKQILQLWKTHMNIFNCVNKSNCSNTYDELQGNHILFSSDMIDDEEITIPSQDRNREVPDLPDFDIRDEQTLSNTQREDWLLPQEHLHGARPRQTGRERPPVIDNRPLMDAMKNTAVRNPSRTLLLSPGRRILMEEEIFTPPRGAARPLSLRVYHVRYKPYLDLSLMVFRKTDYEMVVSVRRTLGRRWIC